MPESGVRAPSRHLGAASDCHHMSLALDVPASDAALLDTTAPKQLQMTFGIDPAGLGAEIRSAASAAVETTLQGRSSTLTYMLCL